MCFLQIITNTAPSEGMLIPVISSAWFNAMVPDFNASMICTVRGQESFSNSVGLWESHKISKFKGILKAISSKH